MVAMGSYIDIKKLTIDELAGVVNLYPWFGGARKELCARMSQMGDSWGKEQYAEAAMYVGSRGKLASMMRSANPQEWTDADIEDLIKATEKRKTYAGVGDYFSQEEIDYDEN